MTDMVEEELLDAMTDTIGEDLLDFMTDTVTGGLPDALTDTIEGGLLGIMMYMVAGAMSSCFSVSCMPAQLHLKLSKSFLVIAIQFTMGEPSASQ